MQQLKVIVNNHRYTITIAAGVLTKLLPLTPLKRHQNCLIVTDQTVAPFYLSTVYQELDNAGIVVDSVILPAGESHKVWSSVEKIVDKLLTLRAGRDVTLLALGGGVIGDLTGFAAACYQRGVRYLLLPTTLLAQVDAAIGGKTAINHPQAKNLIGAFHHPVAVVIDINTLKTLAKRHFVSGLAEVIKYGMVLDAQLFSWLETHIEALIQRSPRHLIEVISRCCALKIQLIARDERDQGDRRLLNFGHTIAHAIEAHTQYCTWLHGEAVAMGMLLESRIAEKLGLLQSSQFRRLQHLMQRAQLPAVAPPGLQNSDYHHHLQWDKKVIAGRLPWILPTGIGEATILEALDNNLLDSVLTASRA
ncbi:MAG: 3-dehydroquinate synthase [Candidatus Symbiodolus clandestinus]